MIINDLYNNKKQNISEGVEDQVVFSGTGADGSTYEIIQSSPTDFMIHANGKHIDSYHSLQRAMSVLKNEVPGLQQGVAEGKADSTGSWVVYKDTKVTRFKTHDGAKAYAEKNGGKVASAEYYHDKIQKQGVAEASLGDYRKKAALSKATSQMDRFFGRDDPAQVAAADQTIAKRERGLARADARVRPYTPPVHDAEKYQRDLTAKYPNIDELVADAERNRDPYYDRAEGNAYYRGREAEQNYQRLKQIQRVIQGLNESLQTVKEFNPFSKKKVAAPASTADSQAAGGMKFDLMGRPYKPVPVTAEPEPVTEPVAKSVGTAMPINPYQIPISNTNPTPAKPAVTPNTAMTTVNPPKFNTGAPYTAPDDDSELQTIPAPAQLTGPAPVKRIGTNYRDDVTDVVARAPTVKRAAAANIPALPAPAASVTPNYGKSVADYSNTTMNAPTVSVPGTRSMQPANMMPKIATAAPPVERNNSDVFQALTGLGFNKKEAKAAIKQLPPNISTKDAIFRALQLLGKSTTTESLTWSRNFDPGRSLYRIMKKEY